MKNFIFALAIICCGTVAAAEEIKVTVKGMVCAFCAQGITKSFNALPEIQETRVDLKSKIVSLKTKDGEKIGDVKIKEVVNNSGYEVVEISRKN